MAIQIIIVKYIFLIDYIEMETGTYITQINQQNRQHQTGTGTNQKFTRCAITQPNKPISDGYMQPLKKTNIIHRLAGKNMNSFPPQEYYSMKKVKPGMAFYKIILQTQYQRKNTNGNKIPNLHLNVPETLLFYQNCLELIHTQPQTGTVRVNSQINCNQFLKTIKPHQPVVCAQKQQQMNKENTVYPSLLTGVVNGCTTDFSINLSNEFDSKIIPRNQSQISIKFTQPFARCPNILRLFYTPRTVKNCKPSYAYKAINKKILDQQILLKKYKQVHNYVVDFSKEQYIITTLVKGKALSEVEPMSQSIIDYLEYNRNIKITQIVVDYIFGSDRVYYFHEIKSIKSVSVSNNIWEIGTEEEISQNYKQKVNQICCRLCGYYFPKIQMDKLVTNKLIVQLLVHLRNRGENVFDNNPCKSVDLSGSSNVCQLCYQLIVAEHRLINIEHQFCSYVNVNCDPINRVKSIPQVNSCPPFGNQQSEMVKWRIFFYIQKLKNAPLGELQPNQNVTLSMKFSDIKQTFVKKCHNEIIDDNVLYKINFKKQSINFSRSTSATTCKKTLCTVPSISRSRRSDISRNEKKATTHTTCSNSNGSYDNLNLNLYQQRSPLINFQKIKLITFYTKCRQDSNGQQQPQQIRQILANQPLTFQLSYKDYKYKGESSTLLNFSNKKQCQRYSCQVLLFDQKYQYCNLELNVGLICDGKVSTQDLSLYKSPYGSLFLSNSNTGVSKIHNPGLGIRAEVNDNRGGKDQVCTALPPEWIQVISQGLVFQPQSSSISKEKGSQRQKQNMDTNIDSSMRSRRSHLRRVQSGFIVRNVSVSNSIGIATTNINGNTTANPSIHTNANMERKREGCNVEISQGEEEEEEQYL